MGLDGVESIPDAKFDEAISNSTSEKGELNDALITKYWAAYLLAKSQDWVTLQKNADVSFNKPNPETYEQMYKEREAQIYYVAFG